MNKNIITNIAEVKSLLYENSLRYYSITQILHLKPKTQEFKITLENINEEISLKIENILNLGYKNIEFHLIDLY